MALTNIELYEELKKDLSERSARMIAEALSPAGRMVEKVDHLAQSLDQLAERVDRLFVEVAAVRSSVGALERKMDERFVSLERRFFVVFAVPLWGAVAAGLVKLYIG